MPDKEEDGDDLAKGPLTDAELKKVRRIILEEDRSKWFWREARRWGGYGAAAIGGIYASWEFLGRLVNALIHSVTRGSP